MKKCLALMFFCVIAFTFSCKEKVVDPSVKAREDSIKLANRKYDIEFERELIALGIDEDTTVNDFLKVSNPDTITYLYFFKAIERFNGIEVFKNLERLQIEN